MIAVGTHQNPKVLSKELSVHNGKDQISVGLEIAGERIYWRGWFTEAASARTIKAMQTMGWTGGPTGDDVTDLEGIGSKVFDVVVEHEEYNGKTQAKIKWVNAPYASKALPPEAAQSLRERMKARVAALKSNEPPVPGDSDEIPF